MDLRDFLLITESLNFAALLVILCACELLKFSRAVSKARKSALETRMIVSFENGTKPESVSISCSFSGTGVDG